VLPDFVETVVLHRLLLVRSDELPDLGDTESVRLLAGYDRHGAGETTRWFRLGGERRPLHPGVHLGRVVRGRARWADLFDA